MAKRFSNKNDDKKLERTIIRNWIITGISGALIIALIIFSKMSA